MFTYDQDESERNNFEKWRWMNRSEREELGVAPLSEEEARWVFNQLKDTGWLKKKQDEADQEKRVSS
jgi:hypothetical protein